MSATKGSSVFSESLGAEDIQPVFGTCLVELGRQEPSVAVLDCQTAVPTMAAGFGQAFPDRFLDFGVAEQNALSFAAGLARVGLTPVDPHFACFVVRRAFDQI